MAERLLSITSITSVEYLLTCQFCFEDYEDTGDRVPKILQCGHTLCHACVQHLVKDNKLCCPYCNRKHEVAPKERNQTQNRYLQVNIRKEKLKIQDEPEAVDKCQEHGKEMMFLCKKSGSQKPVCSVCLTEHYKTHDIVEIEAERKEEIMKSFRHIKRNLQARVRKILPLKEHVMKKTENCITKLQERKEEMNQEFDRMIKDAKEQVRDVKNNIDGEVSAIKYNAILLDNITRSIEDDSAVEILRKLEMVGEIEENIRKHLSGPSTFEYLEYIEAQAPEEVLYGNVMRKEISMDFRESNKQIDRSKEAEAIKDTQNDKDTTKSKDPKYHGKYVQITLADPGGAAGTPLSPPKGPDSFVLTYKFCET